MPARMWKHAVHSFLELLRHRLPDSIDHMISFIYFAYQMMAFLYETVPASRDAWIECLGNLGRYRMAIEDEDFEDRGGWAGVARSWYSKAADQSSGAGRLYRHLAILARPITLQPLYLYCRSLTCTRPFQSAQESTKTSLDSLMRGQVWAQSVYPSDWFNSDDLDAEERAIDHASTMKMRSERIFWYSCRFSSTAPRIDNKRKKWIEYDRSTYSKTVDRSPRVGRLYQHLAILTRPDSPQQIYPYCNTSLTDIHPFQFTRENIKSFFDPLDGSAGRDASSLLVTRIDSLYMKPHGWIHLCKRPDGFKLGFDTYVRLLSEHIELPGTNWREGGANVATSGISALLEHSKSHIVRFERPCPPPLKTESGGSVLGGHLTRGQVWLHDFNGIKQIEPQFLEADISGGRELHVLRNSAQRMPSPFVRAIELLYRYLQSIVILKLFTLVHASPGTKHQPVQRNLATLFTHDSEPIEYRDRTPFDYAVYPFGMFLFAITQYLGKAARPVTISVELVTGVAIPLLRSDPTFRGPAIWSLLKIWGFACGSDSILACRFSQNRRLQKVLEFLTLLFGIFTGMTLQQNGPGSFINSATVSWPVGISLSSFLVDVLPTLDSASNSIVVPNSNISIPSDDVEPGPPSTGANPEDFRINRVLHEPAHREPRSPSTWSFPRRPRTFFYVRRTRSDIPTPHDEANVPLPELPHPSNFDIDIDSTHGIGAEENSTAETPLLPHA